MFKKLMGVPNPEQVIHLGRSVGEPFDPHNGMIARDITDLYYECNAYTDDPYWGIWPKPVRHIVSLPAWMPLNEVRVSDPVRPTYLPLTYQRLTEYRRRRDSRGATPAELRQIWDANNMRDDRIKPTKPIAFDITVGLNPIGVRRFFEGNVFSDPPVIPLTPALLKPYTLRSVIISNLNPGMNISVVHYPIFTGVWHGDTCAGPVFDNMMIRREGGSYPPAFDTTEERNAFFLQICKLLIDGIERDDGNAKLCENHGNFGECLVGLFDPDSTFACRWFQTNHFLKNRAIMRLFHKMVEVIDEIKKVDQMTSLQRAVASDAFKLSAGPTVAKISRDQIMESAMQRQNEETKAPFIKLFQRYYNVAVSIMEKQPMTGVNPLNVELYEADTPDGKTMAHFLAERSPQLLHRIMGDAHFNTPKNSIGYLIPDATGQTPKSIAMNTCTPSVCAFFTSLPDPQVGTVLVDRPRFAPVSRLERWSGSLKSMLGRGGTRRNGTRRNGTRRIGTRPRCKIIQQSKKSRRTTSHRRRSRAARSI
jgi:hypothetical protein